MREYQHRVRYSFYAARNSYEVRGGQKSNSMRTLRCPLTKDSVAEVVPKIGGSAMDTGPIGSLWACSALLPPMHIFKIPMFGFSKS